MSNNSDNLNIRCTTEELEAWRIVAKELDCSLSKFVRTWLNFASERDMMGNLKRR